MFQILLIFVKIYVKIWQILSVFNVDIYVEVNFRSVQMEVQNGIPQVYVTIPDDKAGKQGRTIQHKPWQEGSRDVCDFSDAEVVPYEEVFDEKQALKERDKKLEEIESQKSSLEETAEKLEEIDSPYAKKAGKVFRFGAAVVGIAGTFLASKYSAKLTIETLKSVAKNPKLAELAKGAEVIKQPISEIAGGVKKLADIAMENPSIKANVEKVVNSKAVKTAKAILDNKIVSNVLEPLKNTIKSVKDIKVNGKSVQSGIENTMAATTTGCVIIDDLTGRNNDKSNSDLALGS